QRAARLELCRRQVQIRDGRRAVASGGPGRDRQTSAPQGLMPRSDSPISCAWDRGGGLNRSTAPRFCTSGRAGSPRLTDVIVLKAWGAQKEKFEQEAKSQELIA